MGQKAHTINSVLTVFYLDLEKQEGLPTKQLHIFFEPEMRLSWRHIFKNPYMVFAYRLKPRGI